MKEMLIDDSEQSVLNRWTCFPYFIEEYYVSIRQVPIGQSFILIFCF